MLGTAAEFCEAGGQGHSTTVIHNSPLLHAANVSTLGLPGLRQGDKWDGHNLDSNLFPCLPNRSIAPLKFACNTP